MLGKNKKIIIPPRFDEKLSKGSYIYTLCDNMEPILDLDLYFFREYTKHDESHINAVLEQADALIPDETLEELNEESVEILIAAIIVHDLGMLIHKDGLESILFGKHKNQKQRCSICHAVFNVQICLIYI